MGIEKFTVRVMVTVAVITAIVFLAIGLCFGKVIEGSLFAEVAKWIFIWVSVTVILEGFAYFLAPLWWHFHNK